MLFNFEKNIAYDTKRVRITNDMYDKEEYRDCPYDLLVDVRYIRFYDENEKQSYIDACNYWDITDYGLSESSALSYVYDFANDKFVPFYSKVSELYDEIGKLRKIELMLNPDYTENSF